MSSLGQVIDPVLYQSFSPDVFFDVEEINCARIGRATRKMPRKWIAGNNRTLAKSAIHPLYRAAYRAGPCSFGTLLAVTLLITGCAMQGGSTSPSKTPQATFSQSSVDFGNQDIGTTSNPLSVTLTNTGTADLVISSGSSSPAQFAVANLTSMTVAPGKQAAYSITFTPTDAQDYSGVLSLTTNSSATASVSLAGRGRRRVSISPGMLSFGNQVVNTKSNAQNITVTNTGNSNLVISGISVSPPEFSFTGPTSTTVSPGANVTYSVSFTPAVAQPYSGSLAFKMNTNAPSVSLSGTGVPPVGSPPQVSISPASLSFGNQLINTTSASQSVTVSNTGGSNLVVNSANISPSQFVFTGPSSTTVAPGANVVYNVTFTPTALQPFSGSLVLNTNANPVSYTVAQSGTGISAPPGAVCGKLDDGLVHLPPSYSCSSPPCAASPFSPPARGASYTDPQYGCSVTRLTNAVADNLGAAAHHQYGTITPINADDTYVIVLLENGSQLIVDTTGSVIVPVANMPGTSSGNVPWDIATPTRFYYTAGTTIRRGDISGLPACASTHNCTVTSTTLHDFAGTYANVLIPDQEDISDDGDHLWLVGDTKAFLYTISTNTVGPAMTVGTKDSGTGWHKIQIMPSNRMLMTWSPNGRGPGAGQEVYNTDTTLNWHMFDNTLHTDCGRDLSNNEVCVVARIPDTGGGITGAGACPTWNGSQDGGVDIINMSTHGAQCLVDANWADTEISFRDGNAAGGWVFITFFNSGSCNTYSCFDTTSPSRLDPSWASHWIHFAEEGILVRIDNNNSLTNSYRLFHTRSRSSEYYWAIPRGAISRDGKYVIFDSNFDISNSGLSNYTDVYLTKTR